MLQLSAPGLVLLTLAIAPAAKPEGDWPQWRGPDRTGISAETGLLKEWPAQGPPLLWQVPGIGDGYASVTVSGGRLYTIGNSGRTQFVICLDADDGKQIWKTTVRSPGDGSRSTPTIDGDRLYVVAANGGGQGDLVCLETKDGKELWRRSFDKDFKGQMMSGWGYSESPLIDGDRVICTPGGAEATLAALDKKTGETIWKCAVPGGDGSAYASIVVAEVGGIRQYVTLLGRGIVSVAAKDGKFLWRYNRIANGTANIPTPIVKGDLIFCSTGYGTGAALLKMVPAGDGEIKVEEQKFLTGRDFQNHHGGMILVGDHVYAGHGHNNGAPTCIEFKTGNIAWKEDRGPGSGSAAVVYADGHLYFRYQNALMALIEASPTGFKMKSSFKIPGGKDPSWPHPVIAGGKLFLRDQNQLFCYDVKAR